MPKSPGDDSEAVVEITACTVRDLVSQSSSAPVLVFRAPSGDVVKVANKMPPHITLDSKGKVVHTALLLAELAEVEANGGRESAPEDFLRWAANRGTRKEILSMGYTLADDLDVMAHDGKGVVGLLFHHMTSVCVRDVHIQRLRQLARGSSQAEDSSLSAGSATGILFAHCDEAKLSHIRIGGLRTAAGSRAAVGTMGGVSAKFSDVSYENPLIPEDIVALSVNQ